MMNYNNIFDSHAHYDDGWFDGDRGELLASLPEKGVCGVVNNAVDLESAARAIAFAEQYPYFYAAVGFHPENLENIPDDYLDRVAALTKHPKVVAVGETGLDYHWDIPKPLQQRVFEEQIRLSLDLRMPIIVHDREAHGDVFDLLRKYKPLALVHCFSGSVELAREAVRLGCYISLGGVVTFKNARHSVEVAADIPLDRLLLETDAPYMSPVPFRGKRCDSSMIIYAAEKIAALRGIGTQELLNITLSKRTCANTSFFLSAIIRVDLGFFRFGFLLLLLLCNAMPDQGGHCTLGTLARSIFAVHTRMTAA